jgi:hypothetical protein
MYDFSDDIIYRFLASVCQICGKSIYFCTLVRISMLTIIRHFSKGWWQVSMFSMSYIIILYKCVIILHCHRPGFKIKLLKNIAVLQLVY